MHPLRIKRVLSRRVYITIAILFCIAYQLASRFSLEAIACVGTSCLLTNIRCKLRTNDWNILYHLGGNSPWIPCKSLGSVDHSLPAACHVQQAHLLSRHAERYPTKNAGRRHLALLNKLQNPSVRPQGSLSFLRHWSYFTDITLPNFDNLTKEGPYAGTAQAFHTGIALNKRYGHLVSPESNTTIWTCSSPRDIETAQSFAAGFFGDNWQDAGHTKLHIIPESRDRGGNTLTPGHTCLNYIQDKSKGHDYGYERLARWQEIFATRISARMQHDLSGLQLEPIEVYSMMEMCAFEILVHGSSPWCNVFSRQEWLEFEYARDLLHFYRAGPGNRYAGSMGWLWVNATLSLLLNGNKGVYFSFVHDSDLITAVTALGILEEKNSLQELPVDRVKQNRIWKTSDIVPMGGHIIIEKIACGGRTTSDAIHQSYIRLIVNGARFDLDKLVGDSDIAGTTSIRQFERYVQDRGNRFDDFSQVCGLPKEAPTRITFLQPEQGS